VQGKNQENVSSLIRISCRQNLEWCQEIAMANCGGLCLMVQPRMELNCINFCSANASQSFAQGACVSGAYLHRRKWDGTSSLSGSNLMMISKRLKHHRGGETASFVLSADTSRRNSRAEVLRRVIADRGTTTDEVLADRDAALIQDDVGKARERVEYNWEEEWYPMYLTAEMPSDSPLGLTVFDRSLVLFYDGDGKIHCLEDRCPHRCNIFFVFCTFKFRSFSSGFCNTEMLGFVGFSYPCAPFWSLGQVQQQGKLVS
jgi:hypothetical protein